MVELKICALDAYVKRKVKIQINIPRAFTRAFKQKQVVVNVLILPCNPILHLKASTMTISFQYDRNLFVHFVTSFTSQGILISHNASARVIRSNQSLVLQKVNRNSSGNYSCSAINAEGETVSNQLPLRVKCKCFLIFSRCLEKSLSF